MSCHLEMKTSQRVCPNMRNKYWENSYVPKFSQTMPIFFMKLSSHENFLVLWWGFNYVFDKQQQVYLCLCLHVLEQVIYEI